MAFFRAYLDASGSARDPSIDVLSVGGYVAHEDQWRDFERKWPPVLNEFGVTEFHMAHFAHSEGEFTKWKDKKWEPTRRAFIQAITKVINECTRHPVGVTVDLPTYKWFNERFFIKEHLGTPYGMAALGAIAATIQWKERNNIAEPILFFFEKGDNEQPDFRNFLTDRIAFDEFLVEPVFCKKRWVDEHGDTRYGTPFQASDFIAYEQAKAWSDAMRYGKLDARHSARGIISADADIDMWKVMNRHVLWNFVKNEGIPQRAHDREVYTVPTGPLCYLGLDFPLMITAGKFNN